jgi:hypothetical protein
VLIPGSMGTCSYVLAGVPGGGAFASTCHGAGRVMSRHEALRRVNGSRLQRWLEARGIAVRGSSARGLAEEAPDAYKDVTAVVTAAEGADLCRKVARLVPLGVVKGLASPGGLSRRALPQGVAAAWQNRHRWSRNRCRPGRSPAGTGACRIRPT